jgi:tRNA-Thr(GGU) m(6)t(6)A37 methyltransferase TsaA
VTTAFTFEPIGVVRSPFTEKAEAPRQATAAKDVEATIELVPGRGLEHALDDLTSWGRIWVVFVFDRVLAESANVDDGSVTWRPWRAKVLPPRSAVRRGLFATRTPHRPNPIGLSAVRLVGVEGLVVRIRDCDLLDGTPVLDIKPYVPYADAFPDAGSGWLEAPLDPVASYRVAWSDEAASHRDWLAARGVELGAAVERALALGPAPNAYRRIKQDAEGSVLAVKEWRVRFEASGEVVTVRAIRTGYRPKQLATSSDPAVDLHRAFVAAFG